MTAAVFAVIKQRSERIDALIAGGPKGIILGPADSDVAHADRAWLIGEVERLEAGIREELANCEGCAGRGYDVHDVDGEAEKEPCNSCWDLRQLIQDQTDYVLKATEAKAPKPEVGPTGTCLKSEWCILGDGHEGGCDDGIPF